jgi:hypothetical protein
MAALQHIASRFASVAGDFRTSLESALNATPVHETYAVSRCAFGSYGDEFVGVCFAGSGRW